jgi:hypothetical protein
MMDDATIMKVLFWLVVVSAWFHIAASWLFRRRLKAQHQMLVTIYSEVAKNRQADAETWRQKATDVSLSPKERRLAFGFAAGAIGNANAYADVAADIEHMLINGKTFESRRMIATEESSPPTEPPPEPRQTVVFMSKGGDA